MLNSKLYIIGGEKYNADGYSTSAVAAVSVYDPATDKWSLKASLPAPRFNVYATRVTFNGSSD